MLVKDREVSAEVLKRFQRGVIKEVSSSAPKASHCLLITGQLSNEVTQILKTLPHDQNLSEVVVTNVNGKLLLENVFQGEYPSITKFVFVNCGLNRIPHTFAKHFPNVRILSLANNRLKSIPDCVGDLANLQSLQVSHNKLITLPATLANLFNSLKVVDMRQNSIRSLPTAVTSLVRKLMEFHCSNNPLTKQVGNRKEDVVNYLEELQEGIALDREIKLVLVGNQTVGKTTLVKALTSASGTCKKEPPKTDGIKITNLTINGIKFKIFDTGGDADFLETHLLFTSPDCLYLNVFNLATTDIEGNTGSQLGRLQRWLNSIYTQAPTSRNLIVGTHADDPKLGKEVKAHVEERLKKILETAHQAHRRKFLEDAVEDCILCQDDLDLGTGSKRPNESEEKKSKRDSKVLGANKEKESVASQPTVDSDEHLHDETSSIIANMPHIVGYYEVSSVTKYPSKLFGKNSSVQKLKKSLGRQAEKVLEDLPKTPEKWMDVRKNLSSHSTQNKENPVLSKKEVQEKAAQYGVTKEEKFALMLRFFNNVGHLVHHKSVPDTVVLDPQWLSDRLSSLLSFKQNWLQDGILTQEDLKRAWKSIDVETQQEVLKLFRHFKLCFRIDDKRELFPCRLPVGQPHPSFWPPVPKETERQVSYMCWFSFVSNVLFPEIIVEVNRDQDLVHTPKPRYFCNRILYETSEDPRRCGNCDATPSEHHGKHHRVHVELIHQNNAVMVTVRGPRPCCIASRLCDMIKSIAGENVTVKLSLICPQCLVGQVDKPMTLKINTTQPHLPRCDNEHQVGSVSDVYQGKLIFDLPLSVESKCGRVDNTHCPRLFVMLPVNKEALSPFEYIQYTILKDGFAVHFLCEQPGECHFLSEPGFPLRRVESFVEMYGGRAFKMMEEIVKEKVLPPVDSTGQQLFIERAYSGLQGLLDSYQRRFQVMKTNAELINLEEPTLEEGLGRKELKKLLSISCNEDQPSFPGLCPFQKKDKVLWLCHKHYQATLGKKKESGTHHLPDSGMDFSRKDATPMNEENAKQQAVLTNPFPSPVSSL